VAWEKTGDDRLGRNPAFSHDRTRWWQLDQTFENASNHRYIPMAIHLSAIGESTVLSGLLIYRLVKVLYKIFG
jgi:hypothetical protein